jgi:hypothetical protein
MVISKNLFRNVSGSNVLIEDASNSKGIKIEQNRFVGMGRYRHGVMGTPGATVSMLSK